jgi:hypothetical protein
MLQHRHAQNALQAVLHVLRERRAARYNEPQTVRPLHIFNHFRLVDNAYMGRHDAPAFRESHPCLHLPSNFTGCVHAVEQRRCDGVVATVGTDYSSR